MHPTLHSFSLSIIFLFSAKFAPHIDLRRLYTDVGSTENLVFTRIIHIMYYN